MSRRDDYEAEMAQSTLTDLEIERLLSGITPDNDEAAQLVALLELIRVEGDRSPSDASVALVAGQAASIARSAPPAGNTPPARRDELWGGSCVHRSPSSPGNRSCSALSLGLP